MKWPAAAALLALAGLLGCGSQYRPVINPVVPTGPASQPTSYVAVVSQPGLMQTSAAAATPPCPSSSNPYDDPGVITILDASGDSVAATATLGYGPLGVAVDPYGADAMTTNCDGTLSQMQVSNTLMSKDVNTSTLLSGSVPINTLYLQSTEYVVEEGHDAIAVMSSTPPALKEEIPVAPSVINLTGISTGKRVYSISQGNSGTGGNLAWGACGDPSTVTTDGEADGIEVASDSISSRIPLGVCPVYGVTSQDGNRSFILNRGSGTITVINDQSNQLDDVNNSKYVVDGTINLCSTATNILGPTAPCNAGPVYADFYPLGNLLVVANYDNNTISIIDTSLDVYGNDSATFGKILATVPVGKNPAAVSVLQDGSRVYVANEGDGTVSVVSLTSFQPLATIQLPPLADGSLPQPRSIVSNFNYPNGNVFVGAQNSPYVTVIRTDNDTISANILVSGNVVDLQTSSQYAGQTTTNYQIDSRSVGSGQP